MHARARAGMHARARCAGMRMSARVQACEHTRAGASARAGAAACPDALTHDREHDARLLSYA